jgi:hypothetical protein
MNCELAMRRHHPLQRRGVSILTYCAPGSPSYQALAWASAQKHQANLVSVKTVKEPSHAQVLPKLKLGEHEKVGLSRLKLKLHAAKADGVLTDPNQALHRLDQLF